MEIKKIDDTFSVGPQIAADDVPKLKDAGFKAIIVNRPDGEADDQPDFSDMETAAKAAGMSARHIPVVSGEIGAADVSAMQEAMRDLDTPVYAYCRSGTRATTLWAKAQIASGAPAGDVTAKARSAGYDIGDAVTPAASSQESEALVSRHDIVIVGGGAAGMATAASLLAREPNWT